MSRRKQARPIRVHENDTEDKSTDEQQPTLDANGIDGHPSTTIQDTNTDLDPEDGSDNSQHDTSNNNETAIDENPSAAVPGHVQLEALQNTRVAVAQISAAATNAHDSENNDTDDIVSTELKRTPSRHDDKSDDGVECDGGGSSSSGLTVLQHQQLLQLQMIQELQQTKPVQYNASYISEDEDVKPIPLISNLSAKHRTAAAAAAASDEAMPPAHDNNKCKIKVKEGLFEVARPIDRSAHRAAAVHSASNMDAKNPYSEISSSLAASIITNHDTPSSMDAPNSLEMLQKRAQEVLDSASQGILSGNMADEIAFRKDRMSAGKGNEPFFKHRCRYCGKIFGSDSALQIHLRSHTGERPFKCNVCGSKFTTKGNLKVHYQRHTQRYPHGPLIHPIPENMEKYHSGMMPQLSPGESSPGLPMPFSPGHPFPGFPMHRPPLDILNSLAGQSFHMFGGHHPSMFQDPNNPITMRHTESPTADSVHSHDQRLSERDSPRDYSMDLEHNPDSVSPKEEQGRDEPDVANTETPAKFDECSVDSDKYNCSETPKEYQREQEQPENLSKTTTTTTTMMTTTTTTRRSPVSTTSSNSGSIYHNISTSDPSRDPVLYSSMLPRPGSNDSSWESLIEVTKTSETSKLQQLVDNLENKITDPNECIVCHKVLSCRSALQMHYRTHTGERPFRCRICGRAFTTKGNLKTHMGVHRIKLPVQSTYQCPVCHKRYTSGLVLQQHIRQHTGEQTDLTAEQIQDAEILDYTSPSPGSQQDQFGYLASSQHGMDSSLGDQDDFFDDASDCDFDMDNNFDEPQIKLEANDAPPLNTSISALENQVKTMTNIASQLSASHLNTHHRDLTPPISLPKLNNQHNNPHQHQHHPVDKSPQKSANLLLSPPPATALTDSNVAALDLTAHSNSSQASPPVESTPSPAPPPPQQQQQHQQQQQQPQQHPQSNHQQQQPPPHHMGFFPNLPSFLHHTAPGPLLNSIAQSVMPAMPFNPLGFAGIRGNTTCNICFKTFACHSALEIHYRSHTKERPFKCTICDRGFSTKGNMKQHMLTHKIRDLPQSMFNSGGSQSSGHTPRTDDMLMHQTDGSDKLSDCSDNFENGDRNNMESNESAHSIRNLNQRRSSMDGNEPALKKPNISDTANLAYTFQHQFSSNHDGDQPMLKQRPPTSPQPQSKKHHPDASTQPLQQMAASAYHHYHHPQSLPLQYPQVMQEKPTPSSPLQPVAAQTPKSQSVTPSPSSSSSSSTTNTKHLCRVCCRNFSSSSAVHIHMRTHTGDKPFVCSVCSKAFTTKGNLKVHMSIHMPTSVASRRGRRMSLELPLNRPPPWSQADGEFLYRRPDVFYTYGGVPNLTEIHQKMSENMLRLPYMQPKMNGSYRGPPSGHPLQHLPYPHRFPSKIPPNPNWNHTPTHPDENHGRPPKIRSPSTLTASRAEQLTA